MLQTRRGAEIERLIRAAAISPLADDLGLCYKIFSKRGRITVVDKGGARRIEEKSWGSKPMKGIASLLTSEMTRRHWAIAMVAGAVSFGSVSWFVRGEPPISSAASVSPALPRSPLELPNTLPFAPKRMAEVHELPDITLDSLKASGITEGEIVKAIDKLLDEKSKGDSVLAGEKVAPGEASTTPMNPP